MIKRFWWAIVGGAVGLLLFGLAIYSQTFDSAYHLDDFFFVLGNPGIRDLANWRAYGEGVIQDHSRYAVFATFALNYAIHNVEVFGYHVVNFAIHILAGFCVWWLSCLILRTQRFTYRFSLKEQLWLGFFVGALFIAHPVQTQAVTYISQRFASHATLYYLLALCLYLQARVFSQGMKQIWLMLLAGLAAFISFNSKEIAITLPLMVIFFELYIIPKEGEKVSPWMLLKKYWPVLLVLFGFVGFILYRFDFNIMGMLFSPKVSESNAGDVMTFANYQMTQWRVWGVFFRLLFLPINQNLDYIFPMSHSLIEPPTTLLALLFLIGLIAVAWRWREKWPYVTFGIVWFFITLSVNVVPRAHVIFEHKLYLVSFGVLFAAALVVASCLRKGWSRWFVLSVMVVVLGFMTFERNKVWETEVSLWSDVVKKSPNKQRANLNLGKAYVETGELDLAMKYLNRALELKPGDEKALNNRGLVYHKRRQYDKALADFNKAASFGKNYVEVYNNRGVVYKDLGEYDKALADYQKALQINPQQPETRNNMGVVFRKQKRYEEALREFNLALKLKFNKYPDALVNIGNVYKDLGELDKALSYYNQAIALNGGNAIYYANRGNVLKTLGRNQQAFNDLTRAIQLSPNMPVLYFSRGLLFQQHGKWQQAFQDYARAVHLDPGNVNAQNNIAVVLYRLGQYEQAMAQAEKALAIYPKLPSAYNILLMSCLDKGDGLACESYLERAQEQGLGLNQDLIDRINKLKAN